MTFETFTLAEDTYLVWSNEHRAWWKAGGWGYATGLRDAGQFTREKALQICRDALPTAMHLGAIAEIPVRADDVMEFLHGQKVPNVVVDSE